MKKLFVYLFLLIPFLYSCEKDNDTTHSENITFENIKTYSDKSVSLNFNIVIPEEYQNATIDWIFPDSLSNKKSGAVSFKGNLWLEYNLVNADNHIFKTVEKYILIDTMLSNDKYDFRNDYEGDYNFIIRHTKGDDIVGCYYDTTYSRIGFVKKQGDLSLSLLEVHYGTNVIFNYDGMAVTENNALVLSLDNELSYYPKDIYGSYYAWGYGTFSNFNSLYLTVSMGGMGFWNSRYITATKIISN